MKLIPLFVVFSSLSAIISIIYKKKYLLSILLAMELLLLNLLLLKFSIITLSSMEGAPALFSLFIIALSAMEASIGMSILTLMTRKFKSNNVKLTNMLKK